MWETSRCGLSASKKVACAICSLRRRQLESELKRAPVYDVNMQPILRRHRRLYPACVVSSKERGQTIDTPTASDAIAIQLTNHYDPSAACYDALCLSADGKVGFIFAYLLKDP